MTTPPTKLRPLPIIRLFVSSTFSDQQHERNALHAEVWPKLERYCQQRGFTFQAIDLRWGVPAEAGLHHRTMGVCFEELRRSQKTSPEPNFLILLGNRYGWRPLPEVISIEEYGDLLKYAYGEAERAILETWYRLDTNAIPAVHLLRSRKDSPDGKDYTQIRDADGNLVKKEDGSPLDTDHWLSVQKTLWEIVNRAFPVTDLAGRFRNSVDTQTETVPSIVRFQTSATEQEIWQGALKVENAKEHVIACFRTIQKSDAVPPPTERKKFVDLQPDGSDDGDTQNVLDQLKEQLAGRLNPTRIIRTRCQWATDEGGQLTGDVTTEHIAQLCDDVYTLLEKIVIKQINEYWGCNLSAENATVAQVRGTKQELDIECADHQRFAEERAPAGTFIGRETEIASIRKYLSQPTNKPLIVHGPSGSGKTALLGKVIQDVTPRNPDGTRATTGPIVLSRFIGTTPESSNLRSLLSSLCRELRQEFPVTKTETTQDGRTVTGPAPFPTDLNPLVNELYSQLARATATRPVYVFLDALDQIDAADNARLVYWIRRELVSSDSPCHAMLVATCLSPSPDPSEDGLTEDSAPCEPYRHLKQYEMLNGEPLGTLSEEQSRELFQKWLEAADRQLSPESPEQNQLIQSALRIETCRSPLYLKVLSEEARRWRSFDKAPVLPESLPDTLPQLLAALLNRLDQLSEHGPLARIALSLLVSARYGLSEGELLEILYTDEKYKKILADDNKRNGHELPPLSTRIPIAPWTRLRSDLAPYLSERSAPGTAVMHFYHRQVEQAVRTQYLKPSDSQTSRHRQLAKYFDGRWNLPDSHALMELPHLCLLCEDHDALFELLTDLPFPMRKTHAGYVSDLVQDVVQLRARLSGDSQLALEPWYYFIRGNAAFLAKHPECFFQQAYNEPVDSPISLAAQCGWASLIGEHEPPDSTYGFPLEFLEWINRPATWRVPACQMTLFGHENSVTSVAATPDGGTIVSGSEDNTVRIWDALTGQCRRILTGHNNWVTSVAVSEDGKTIVSGSNDTTVKVWDALTGHCLRTLSGHENYVNCVMLSHLGETIASASSDGTIRVWETSTGRCNQSIYGDQWEENSPIPRGFLCIAVSRDLETIISGSYGGHVTMWDTRTGQYRCTLSRHEVNVYGVAISEDVTKVVLGASGNLAEVWDARTGACLHVLTGHSDEVRSVAISRDGDTITSASHDKTLKIWDSMTGECRRTLTGHTNRVNSVAIIGHGTTIVSGSDDNTVKLWSVQAVETLRTVAGHTSWVWDVAISQDGETVASGSVDKTVKVWNARTGECQFTLLGHQKLINKLLFSLDGKTIVSASWDKTLRMWDVQTGQCIRTFVGHKGWINSVAISEDGGKIVSVSEDKVVKVWDSLTGECQATFTELSAGERAVSDSVVEQAECNRLSTDAGMIHCPATSGKSIDLIFPGSFDRAYGPLASDTILAFSANGEAHWFRLRRRDGA